LKLENKWKCNFEEKLQTELKNEKIPPTEPTTPCYIPTKAVNNILILNRNGIRNIFGLLIQLNGQIDWPEKLLKTSS